jgi:hypothetical protein
MIFCQLNLDAFTLDNLPVHYAETTKALIESVGCESKIFASLLA